jgi:hypothetical protein
VTVVLKVDAFSSGISCQQDPDRFLLRVLGELRTDVLTFLGLRGTLDDSEDVAIALLRKNPCEPVDRMGVLGEDHDAFVRPVRAARATHAVEEGQQRFKSRVRTALVTQTPVGQGLELCRLSGAEWVGALGVAQPLRLVLLPQSLFFVGLALAEDVVVVVVTKPAPSS